MSIGAKSQCLRFCTNGFSGYYRILALNSLNKDAVNHTGSGNSINNSENTTADSQDAKADLKKIAPLMIENAAKIKNDFGIDVTNAKGLGEAVAKYCFYEKFGKDAIHWLL